MTAARHAALTCALAAAACGPAPPPAGPAPTALPVFTDVADAAGLVVSNHTGRPDHKDWIVAGMGGGTIVLDYDQDGRMDVLVVDGTMLTEDGELQYDDAWRTRLFRNLGGLRFTEVTRQAGIDIQAFGFGGASCDYDGDGWPDVYVCCWGRNRLLRNRGDGTFEDVTAKAGVAGGEDEVSTACCWGDVDGDGVPDLFVVNYLDQQAFIDRCRRERKPGRQSKWRGVLAYAGPKGLAAQPDRLYLGRGDGTFRDATLERLGREPSPGYGFQAVMTDADNDGDLDIFVPNDTVPNLLWVNDGRGRFREMGVEAGVALDFDGHEQASMGVSVADVNRDGWLDVFVTEFSHAHNTLYVNQTGRTGQIWFKDLSNAWNVAAPSYLRISWGTRLFDYDNDGELDLFAACGHVYGDVEKFEQSTGTTYRQRCLLERGVGPPERRFEDVTDRGGPAFEIRRVWRGAAFGDYDDDGDLDVVVTALNDRAALFRNDGGDANGFLVFRLVGRPPLRDPCGARVTVRLADGVPRVEELHHGISYCGDDDPRLFFGLGRESAAKSVEVRWPNGEKQTFADVPGRRFYLIEQGRDALREDGR